MHLLSFSRHPLTLLAATKTVVAMLAHLWFYVDWQDVKKSCIGWHDSRIWLFSSHLGNTFFLVFVPMFLCRVCHLISYSCRKIRTPWVFHHEITIIITQEPWQETECPGHDSWVMWNYLDNIFWAKVLRHFLHGTSLFFLGNFSRNCGGLIPRIAMGFTWSAGTLLYQDASKTPPGFWHEPLYIYTVYIIYNRYIYIIYLYFHKDKKPAHGLLEAHIPKEFLALPWGLLLSFDDGALMESWNWPFLKCGWTMGESLSDYPPTTKYTLPLKVTIFIHFRESSFYSKASFLFGGGPMLFQCPQPRCTSKYRIAKSSERNPLGTTSGVSLTTYTKKTTFHGLEMLDHSERMLCHTHQFSHLSWKRICQFPMKYISTFQVWDGQINTCNSWQLFAVSTWFVRVWRSIHQVPH